MKLKPAIVLSVITTAVAAILIITNNRFPYDPNKLSEDYLKKCREIMGDGEYVPVVWEDTPFSKQEKPAEVNRIILNRTTNDFAIEVVTKGYNEGLTVLVALNPDATVKKVAIVAGTETPGLGTKAGKPDFLSRFSGKGEVTLVKRNPKEAGEVQAITGATRSSEGVAKAVNIAVKVYENYLQGENANE
jgi:electron transport complex protein RnfG